MAKPQSIKNKERIADYNEYSSVADASGKYTIVELKRADGTLYMKSTASNADVKGNYQTVTVLEYNNAGTTVVQTYTWTLTYDASGTLQTKVVAVT